MKNIYLEQKKKQKPNINLTVLRVEPDVWVNLGFYKHHYLTQTLNKSCKCLLFLWENIPVAFVGILNSPRKGKPWGHSISRIVVLPDFQGLGLSSIILNFCGGILKALGNEYELYIKTIHTKMGAYLTSSPLWIPTQYNGKIRNQKSIESEGKKYHNRLARQSYCFKYCGEPIYGYEELLLPINELRKLKNKNNI